MLDMASCHPYNPDQHSLHTLLSRASSVQHTALNFDHALFSLLGVETTTQQDLPLAACAARVELKQNDSDWLLLEPVHLRADQATLRLFDAQVLGLEAEEINALFAACQAFFAEHGLVLERGEGQYWYLQFSQCTAITTTSLYEVIGQSIDPLLPVGDDAMYWHRLMNELQMMLHTHPVNVEREDKRQPMVNSVWLWGGGSLPTIKNSTFSSVWGGAVEARGLAQAVGVVHAPLPSGLSEINLQQLSAGDHLLIIDSLLRHAAYQDVDDWFDAQVQLCRDWFQPLLEALRERRVDELVIYPVNGRCYRVGRRHLYCFWRRVKNLSAFKENVPGRFET